MKRNISFLSLALLTAPSLMFAMDSRGRAPAPSWLAVAVDAWRANSPLIAGAAAGTALALGGRSIPGALTNIFNLMPAEGRTLTLAAGVVGVTKLDRTFLNAQSGHPSLATVASVGGAAVAAYAVTSQVLARLSR